MISPKEGDVWYYGMKYNITYNSSGVEEVDLVLYKVRSCRVI